MTPSPEWLDRVLAYDDLPADEQADVDILLRGNDPAATLLETIRSIEANQGPAGSLPEDVASEDAVPDREIAESLRRLQQRARFDALGQAPRESAAGVFRSRLHYLLPAAAAAVLVIALGSPLDQGIPGPITNLEVQRAGTTRGGTTDDSAWTTGDAFILHCELDVPSLMVLVHVDPEGSVSILDPEDGEGPISSYAAGAVQFPSAGDEWFLEGSPGPETFLIASIAAASNPDLASGNWARDLMGITRDTDSRDERVARTVRILRNHFDAVQRTDFVHSARALLDE